MSSLWGYSGVDYWQILHGDKYGSTIVSDSVYLLMLREDTLLELGVPFQ
ncbi:hypothetical protein WN944_002741 [Citrus x changshan-huyou]|uniref:Uncharacterized protein n=1 Tax=Citrus x changshan-huyou TaxID=2935761 RepID=A0AAP0QSG1_9ROSI